MDEVAKEFKIYSFYVWFGHKYFLNIELQLTTWKLSKGFISIIPILACSFMANRHSL